MSAPRAALALTLGSRPNHPLQPPSANTWRSRQDELSLPSAPTENPGGGHVAPSLLGVPCRGCLLAWAPPEDRDAVPPPEEVRTALQRRRPGPSWPRGSRGREAGLFLCALPHAGRGNRELRAQVQRLPRGSGAGAAPRCDRPKAARTGCRRWCPFPRLVPGGGADGGGPSRGGKWRPRKPWPGEGSRRAAPTHTPHHARHTRRRRDRATRPRTASSNWGSPTRVAAALVGWWG